MVRRADVLDQRPEGRQGWRVAGQIEPVERADPKEAAQRVAGGLGIEACRPAATVTWPGSVTAISEPDGDQALGGREALKLGGKEDVRDPVQRPPRSSSARRS